jgi:uncharacterized protein YcbX
MIYQQPPGATVAGLYRYPVKSMLGESLATAEIGPQGIVGDRSWALLDVASGKVASAKNPRKWMRLLECRARYAGEPELGRDLPPVLVTLPGGATYSSEDRRLDHALSVFFRREVKLIDRVPEGAVVELVEGPDVAEGAPISRYARERAFAMDGNSVLTNMQLMRQNGSQGFWDSYELHVLTTSSLRKLKEFDESAEVSVARYRPNILVDSPQTEFVEKDWVGRTVSMGPIDIQVELEIPRCMMITLPQLGLPANRSALKTIVRHNLIAIEPVGALGGALGVVGSPVTTGTLTIGADVTYPSVALARHGSST